MLQTFEFLFAHHAGVKRVVRVHATNEQTATEIALLAVGGWRKHWTVLRASAVHAVHSQPDGGTR